MDLIFPNDSEILEKFKPSEDYEEVYEQDYDAYGKLLATLNDEQKVYLEQFMDTQFKRNGETNESYFKAGVKLGVRLAVECLSD